MLAINYSNAIEELKKRQKELKNYLEYFPTINITSFPNTPLLEPQLKGIDLADIVMFGTDFSAESLQLNSNSLTENLLKLEEILLHKTSNEVAVENEQAHLKKFESNLKKLKNSFKNILYKMKIENEADLQNEFISQLPKGLVLKITAFINGLNHTIIIYKKENNYGCFMKGLWFYPFSDKNQISPM